MANGCVLLWARATDFAPCAQKSPVHPAVWPGMHRRARLVTPHGGVVLSVIKRIAGGPGDLTVDAENLYLGRDVFRSAVGDGAW